MDMRKLILLVALTVLASGCVIKDLRDRRAYNIQSEKDTAQCTAEHPSAPGNSFVPPEWAKCMNNLRAEHQAEGADGYDLSPSVLGAVPEGTGYWGYGFSSYNQGGWVNSSWSRSGGWHK
jgi:hypothetical protein